MTGRGHTDREYEAKLAQLREALLEMASRVEQMIGESVAALVERDSAKAKRTIAADSAVNQQELEIDELCLLILARWQPMASDLRFLTLALKMDTDLERIGDLAVNIAERAIDLSTAASPRPYVDIPRMADITCSMIRDAIDAFVEADVKKATSVLERDDEVDALYIKVFRDILEIMREDPEWMQQGIHLQSVAKWLERMADHGTNLAEQVVFFLKGHDIRHGGLFTDAR